MKRIYITYCWQDEKIADTLDYYFQQVGIKLIRDKRDLDYSSSIEDFAKKMRQGSFNICLISDEYLKRVNCMYEINQLLKDNNFARKKFCPIVVDNAPKQVDLSPSSIEEYAAFWKEEIDKQDQLINSISENRNKGEQIHQLKKLEAIYNDIREFLFLLKDAKYIKTSDIEREGIIAINRSIFKKININHKVNLEELYSITQLNNIEDAEKQLATYANNHLIKDNEYFLYTKATVYEKNGYYDLALYNYSLAYKTQKNFVLAYEAIIFLYLKGIYKIDDRFQIVTSGLREVDPTNPLLYIAEALLSLQKQDYSTSITLFESALEHKHSTIHLEFIYNNLANAYERQYEKEKNRTDLLLAEKYYNASINENPQYYQALNNLSLLYLMKLSDLTNAQKSISKCLSICPTYHMALNTQGLIYEEKNEFEKALECYMHAYEYSKSYSPPLNQIGRILDFEYRNPLCKLYYSLAYKINPRSIVNCFNFGNYYRKYTENMDKANNLLEEALSIQPNNILCNMAMGLLKYKIQDYIAARNYFSYAFALNPDYDSACFCLALCEYKINASPSFAKGLLEKYIKTHKNIFCENLLSILKNPLLDTDKQINNILNASIEYEYVNVPEQISKSLIINPIVNIRDAYQYIIDNFYHQN